MKIDFNFSKISAPGILDGLIEAIYLLLIFSVPLWFAYWFPTYNIFEFNKSVLFRLLTWLLLFFTAVRIIFYPFLAKFPPRAFFKKYWLIPTIFIVGLSLTVFGSINPMQSFYGTAERQQGLSSYLFYFLWFILLSFNIFSAGGKSEDEVTRIRDKKIRRIIIAAVLAGSVVSIYGLLQILNIDFLSWPEPPFLTHRTFSTFGQPNFLASWLLLVFPLSVYLSLASRRFLMKSAWFFSGFIQLACLFLTASRGALAALLFTLFLFLIYLFVTAGWTSRKKYLVFGLFLIISLSSLISLDYFSNGRLRELAHLNYGSLGARFGLYGASLDAIPARPFLGYGLENGDEVFIKYYAPDWGVYGDVSQSADRAHNLLLDTLLATGFVGLLLFFILYYFLFSLARDNIREKKSPKLSLALALGAAAYLSSLFFSFTIVSGEIYLWLFLALLVVLNGDRVAGENGYLPIIGPEPSFKTRLFLKPIAVTILFVLVFWQIGRTLQSLVADYYFKQVYITLASRDYFTVLTLDDYLTAASTNPVNQISYRLFLGDKLSDFYPMITDLAAQRAIRDKMSALYELLPDSGYLNLFIKAKLAIALNDLMNARHNLSQVIALTPHWPLAYLEMGKLATAEGDFKEAIVNYHLAFLNLPAADDVRLNEAHRQLVLNYQYFIDKKIAEIYQSQKNYVLAEKYYQAAYGSNPADFTLLKKIADTYYWRGDLLKAIEYNLHGLARNSGDYNWSVALAALYYESGNPERALEYIKQAEHLAPNDSEILKLQHDYSQ